MDLFDQGATSRSTNANRLWLLPSSFSLDSDGYTRLFRRTPVASAECDRKTGFAKWRRVTLALLIFRYAEILTRIMKSEIELSSAGRTIACQ